MRGLVKCHQAAWAGVWRGVGPCWEPAAPRSCVAWAPGAAAASATGDCASSGWSWGLLRSIQCQQPGKPGPGVGPEPGSCAVPMVGKGLGRGPDRSGRWHPPADLLDGTVACKSQRCCYNNLKAAPNKPQSILRPEPAPEGTGASDPGTKQKAGVGWLDGSGTVPRTVARLILRKTPGKS